MIFPSSLVLWFIPLVRLTVALNVISNDDSDGRDFLRNLNEKSAQIASKLVSAQWEFETNNTENAKKELVQVTSKAIQNAKISFQNVINNFPWKSFSNPDVRRQLKLFSEIGTLALPDEDYHQFQKIISDLDKIQQNTTICDYYNKTKCDLHLYPDIQEKLESSQNEGELSYLWSEWRKATEPQFATLLNSYTKLCNQAAALNNYGNFQEYSLRNIESEDIKQEMIKMWEDIKPLYSQIHAYVRRKLRHIYGEKVVPLKGSIPAHLLGNIWAENWLGIAQRVIPFPEQDNFNFTATMISQGYTQETIRKKAEYFLTSVNFSVPPNVWLNASEMPLPRNSDNCRPKIFNFYADGVRIKDCGKISLKEYLEDIRLLTKAEYILQYSVQPFVYQVPANPGLEEAMSNIMAMSASTFENLKKLGLFKGEVTEEIRLNNLFKMALEKITSISFLLVQEFWRWDIYGGKTVEETINTANDLREKFQGISTFTKELTFDPGGIGSAFSKLTLTHHFLGYFLEFQVYESLCQMSKAQQEKDLNECNLLHNVEAGETLRKLMRLGSSKTLSESFSSVMGLSKIDSKSILKYFEPLMRWLAKENANAGEFIGWEESQQPQQKHKPLKTRRKRSLEDYQTEMKDDDTYSTSSSEPDRFQRLIYKRSKNSMDESEMNKRESSRSDKLYEKRLENNLDERHKKRRRVEERAGNPYCTKNMRPALKNNKSVKDSLNEIVSGNNGNRRIQKTVKFTFKNKRHHSDPEGQSEYLRTLSNTGEKTHWKRSFDFPIKKEIGNPATGRYPSDSNGGTGNNNSKIRVARRAQKQMRFGSETDSLQSHQVWPRNDNYQKKEISPGRNVQWHSDTKKDISRLLHSFGFTMENDDKDKIKELKKKLKGDTNSDLKSNIASKEGSYESMVDYSRLKSSDIRGDIGGNKGTNKLWSVKSYLTDNAKIMQSSPSLDKKDSLLGSHLTSSVMSHPQDEKSVGKKEATQSSGPSLVSGKEPLGESRPSSESGLRHVNFEMPSLQSLLQKADLNSYGQKQIFTVTPEVSETKTRNDMNQMNGGKNSYNKYGNNPYLYKYAPTAEMLQYKDKKEFRDADGENGNKSPYIIILGQMTPDMREKLQDKGVNFMELDRQALIPSGAVAEEKKVSDKKGRASEQIYIVPIDLKNSQHNLMKTNHYTEHEHEAGHDPNTERDQESEEEQLHLEDNSKLEDKSSFYKTGKESPSEFIISWNNDKNRKIVKRSKREHKKEITDDKLKVVRIAPSFLEGLLGKSLNQATLDDKNVQILIHDALLNGNSDLSSALASASSPGGSVAVASPVMDQSQTASLQPSSSLSSLASSVLSALSPKGFSQVAKAATQHQDVDLEEENLKENGNVQPLGKKKGAKLHSDDDSKTLADVDPAAKGDDACCKKIILTPCPPRCPCPTSPCPLPCPLPCPCPCPCPPPCPCPCPCPCPDDCCKRVIECPALCCKPECPDICCKKPSECSLVNCQFKITKAKKPHERLTIMIYDRINPPAELPEPYDALAVISEILQRIQCCSCKPSCQLTEEDPDYPANDNTDQLKGNPGQDNKARIQEISGEIPILGNESPEEEEAEDNTQIQNFPSSGDEDKYQSKEKATPALDQLTVFNKDKLKPVFIELRKIDDIIKKRSQKE